MNARRLGLLAALCAAVLAAVGLPSLFSAKDATTVAQAAPAPDPFVTIEAPVSAGGCIGECIRGAIPLTATARPFAGNPIASVAFQRAPAGADDWTTIEVVANASNGDEYVIEFDTNPVAAGAYDLRAVATDTAGGTRASAIAQDRVFANAATYVALAQLPTWLPPTLTVRALTQPGGGGPTHATLERSRAGAGVWAPIATAEAGFDDDGNPGYFAFDVDTRGLADGAYDFRLVARSDDAPDGVFVSRPQRERIVDTKAPTSNMSSPGATLSGEVVLTASASDPGGEVAFVSFERSPAGADSWTAIGARGRSPYEQDFDTRLIKDGRYDFRVVTTDRSGNSAPSAIVSDVQVTNAPGPRADKLTIASVVSPASGVKLLGTAGSGSQRETWAYGTTSAPPALIDGARLPYRAAGNQIVLLRHTDAGGWQIADVLRTAGGEGFAHRAAATIVGQMTSSGEAWIALWQPGGGKDDVALFHRKPGTAGGEFRVNAGATAELRPLLASGISDVKLVVRQRSDGRAHGLLVAPSQPARDASATVAGGPVVPIRAQVDYGVLDDATWTRRTVETLPSFPAREGDTLTLQAADLSGPQTGWGAFLVESGARRLPLLLGRMQGATWTYSATNLDAFDLTNGFGTDPPRLAAPALRADAGGVWIGATVNNNDVVAYYDAARADTTRSWCNLPPSAGCGAPLDPIDHPAALPVRVFDTARGKLAFGLENNFVDVYSHGDWSRVPAPGYTGANAIFLGPGDGWLAGGNAIGRVTTDPEPAPLERWPQANRSTLLSVALPTNSTGSVGDSGALAVGLDGTALRFDASAGWLVEPTPARAGRLALRSVAFIDPTQAVAVGQSGIILRWDGTSWTEDEKSTTATQAELTSVAFGANGDGWAVGRFATILHFDGGAWRPEQLPAEDAGISITSVAVAGSEVFAIAGGNLYQRRPGGSWSRVAESDLPAGARNYEGDLRLVAGLPDGGIVAAGRSVVMVRDGSGGFDFSEQPLEGTAVALEAFRDGAGKVRAFVSLAPDAGDVGFPAGEGELLRQTNTGWQDLSRAQQPGGVPPRDGLVKVDPVLAVATGEGGAQAWAVGGYAGTRTSTTQGTDETLASRATGWRTAQIWRYDSSGSKPSPAVQQTGADLPPAKAGTVSFAYFSNPQCRSQCNATQDAQPDVNLKAATAQIAAFAAQPGGPVFAMLGGNARGPIDQEDIAQGTAARDFPRLSSLLEPLGGVPLFAAFGPRDAVEVPESQSRTDKPWADAFARAPAPFGQRPPPEAITPAGQGSRIGAVHRYYAFDAEQNGGRLRVITLDNSDGSLESTSGGQTAWLQASLAEARSAKLPIVVMVGRALSGNSDEDEALSRLLRDSGVLAIFAAGDNNERTTRPASSPLLERIPQFVGANLGYQRARNNGVVWYQVSVDTAAQTVDVQGIPVIETLAIKPLLGLSAPRSSTLAFEAVGRRPTSTLATTIFDPTFPGFDNYVGIPATGCGPNCIAPSYSFASSDPSIGDFVAPSAAGSRFPQLDSRGNPIASNTSGLFCAYNSGTTTVSVTAGLIKATLPVTVQAGGFGRPCGTVFRAGVGSVIVVRKGSVSVTRQTPQPRAETPPGTPPEGTGSTPAVVPQIALPLPPPAEQSPPADKVQVKSAESVQPPPPGEFIPTILPVPTIGVVAVPPLPAAATPVPPGGSASAQAAARRKEKAHKQASQSAFTVRTTDVGASDWFYPAVGATSLLALMLLAGTMRPGSRPQPRAATVRHGSATSQRRSDTHWRR